MASKSVAKQITRAVDSAADRIIALHRQIFNHPETCFKERFATQKLTSWLEDEGFGIKNPYAGLATAFLASHRGASKGPKVALIAEYDALPHLGHACGHSLIAASAAGAAVALKRVAPDHPGSLLVIGTPAEEGGGGKVKMIREKAFEGVDAALMAHPSNKTRVVCRMYAINELEFTFTGKAAHAAAFPERGVNALDAGVLFYNAVAAMRQQMRSEARVHGIFTHGGDAPNIIPEKVVMNFYVRALDRDYFMELTGKIKNAARGCAKSTGCKVSIKRKGHAYDPFYPNYPMGEIFRKNMELLKIKEDRFGQTEEIGSSDIGNLSQVIPTIHPEYAVGGRDDINHSRRFLEAVTSGKGERAMISMTKTLAMTVHDLLVDDSLIKRVKAGFGKTGATAE